VNPNLTTAGPPPAHPVTNATRGMFMVLNAASRRHLPMPFHASASEFTPAVTLQFHTRAEVVTWAIALDVAEVPELPAGDGRINDRTVVEAVWFEVPLTLVASVPRMPEAVAS